jgi:aspartate racemase
MKTLGVLGGMSWESTAVYYRLVNQAVASRKGGLHSAPLVLASVDFETIAERQRAADWPGAAALLARAASGLRSAGAQALLIATNTMHKVGDEVATAAGLPLLHIADATASALRTAGVKRAAFLGTRFSMEDRAIVIDRLEQHGAPILVPEADDRALMHRVIFEELCRGIVRDDTRSAIAALIARQAARGADAVVLGCTEIGLLIDGRSSPLPCFDTTELHAAAAVDWMMENPR